MAHTTTFTDDRTATDLPTIVRTGLGHVRAHLDARKARSRIRWELNQYTDRELADMGLSRSDIDGIATGAHTR